MVRLIAKNNYANTTPYVNLESAGSCMLKDLKYDSPSLASFMVLKSSLLVY